MVNAASGVDVSVWLCSPEKIDWNAVRAMAHDCLNSTWAMVSWAARSQEDDYDTEKAASHLDAIDTALNTFRRAMEVFQPGLECSSSVSLRHSSVFDALVLATVGEGARPDFRFGPVHCATAHEAAFELLRMGILWVEEGVFEDMDDRWFKDEKEVTIGILHKLPLPVLRDTLAGWGKRRPLAKLLDARGLKALRTWIDLEWAAVSNIGAKPATGGDGPKLRVKVNTDNKVVELDGTPYPLTGREGSKGRLVAFIQALINAKGAPVSATDHGVRTRDIERQHVKIRSLIGDDAKTGSGYRIPLEKLMA
jgi:hypothetical protein